MEERILPGPNYFGTQIFHRLILSYIVLFFPFFLASECKIVIISENPKRIAELFFFFMFSLGSGFFLDGPVRTYTSSSLYLAISYFNRYNEQICIFEDEDCLFFSGKLCVMWSIVTLYFPESHQGALTKSRIISSGTFWVTLQTVLAFEWENTTGALLALRASLIVFALVPDKSITIPKRFNSFTTVYEQSNSIRTYLPQCRKLNT